MNVREVMATLKGRVLVDAGTLSMPVRNHVSSDLMSEVLLTQEEDIIILSSLVSEHVVRTAHVLGAHAIVVLGNREPGRGMLEAGRELGVSIGGSPLNRLEADEILEREFAKDNAGTVNAGSG